MIDTCYFYVVTSTLFKNPVQDLYVPAREVDGHPRAIMWDLAGIYILIPYEVVVNALDEYHNKVLSGEVTPADEPSDAEYELVFRVEQGIPLNAVQCRLLLGHLQKGKNHCD